MTKTYKSGGYKKPVIQAKTFSMEYPPSERQIENRDFVLNESGNGLTVAVAGSGKTTLINYIIQCIKEYSHPFGNFKKPKSILFTSFMNAVVDVQRPYYINDDVVTCDGMHKICFRALQKALGRTWMPKSKNGKPIKTRYILSKNLGIDPFDNDLDKSEKDDVWQIVNAVEKLVSAVKLTLTDWTDENKLNELVSYYGIDTSGVTSQVYELVNSVMKESISNPTMIDFDDMLFTPIHLNLNLEHYEMGFGDEVQDWNAAQQEVAKRLADRWMLVGDDWQAIYGFAMADCHSVENLEKLMDAKRLLLDINYRCGKLIIERAAQLNPIIKAWEHSPDGEVSTCGLREIIDTSNEEDMIISRRNKTLVAPCFALLRSGRNAFIKGKNIGTELNNIFNRATRGAVTQNEAQAKLDKFFNLKKEKIGSEDAAMMEIIIGQHEILSEFVSECNDLNSVANAVESMFKNDGTGTRLSSCHAAKGLESNRVFILDYSNIELNYKGMTIDARQQERHLHYVALTRAKKQLFLHREED